MPSQSPMEPPMAESSPLIEGASIWVIVMWTVSEKERTMWLLSFVARFDISLVLVAKLWQGIGQFDKLLPVYKLFIFSRYPEMYLEGNVSETFR